MKKLLLCLLLVPLAIGPAAAGEKPVWPAPPDKPRIEYLETLTAGKRADGKRGKFGKMLDFLLGVVSGGRSEQEFLRPTGIWVTENAVFVADPGVGRVMVRDKASGKSRGVPSARRHRMPFPVGVAVAPDGRLFVSDPELGGVSVFDPEGKPLPGLAAPPQGFQRPTGLALDAKLSRLYVSDTGTHSVSAYGLDGRYLFTFGGRGGGAGELNYPTYLWADSGTGRVLVCDSGNFRVRIFDPEGKPAGGFGEMGDRPGYLARPRGIAADSDGDVYSVDGALEAVQIFDEKGRLLLYFGESGGAPGYFSMPGGIFVDGQDRIYVADSFNSRVQVFQYLKADAR